MGNRKTLAIATLADCAADASARLEAVGFSADEARRDAVLLARTVLGWTMADWLVHSADPAAPEFASRLSPLVDRRAAREPVAHITGEREFYGRAFRVTRDVLIPRPETELIVEETLRAIESGAVIVDVGTGSGCLAVTLALERPTARIRATDTSASALAVAVDNARRHGVSDRIDFQLESFLGSDSGVGTIDVIAANLPYVADLDRPSLAPDVRDYEPAGALFAGPDGLDCIRRLIPLAAQSLGPGGWLIVEVGLGQADAVVHLIDSTGTLSVDHVAPDLQGIARVVVARK